MTGKDASGPGESGDGGAKDRCETHREALIDESLMESFPASDPPSIARPACAEEDVGDGAKPD